MEKTFEERPTFVGYTGIELTDVSADAAAGRLVITENHHQP